MQYLDYILQHYGWQGTALLAVIVVLFFVQIYYHAIVYGRVARFRNGRRRKRLDAEPAVSVVVPLFSEDYTYMDERLPLLLNQNYTNAFEVVVVYVGSDNDFYEELSNMRLRHPNLIVTKIQYNPRFPISVKMAINVGIKSSHNEHLLITTTDATPASDQWLQMMGKAFMRGEIVLGYTAIEQGKGLTNYLIRLSRMQISVYWLARAVRGLTYRGSRSNIGFTKSLYLQSIAHDNNASVVLIPKGRMIERQWGGMKWWLQHLHHYGEAYRYYPHSPRNAMEWELGSQVLFFLSVVVALVVMPIEAKAVAALLLIIRYLVAMLRARSIAKRVGEKGVALRYFIFDIMNPVIMLCARIAMLQKDSTAWK